MACLEGSHVPFHLQGLHGVSVRGDAGPGPQRRASSSTGWETTQQQPPDTTESKSHNLPGSWVYLDSCEGGSVVSKPSSPPETDTDCHFDTTEGPLEG